MKQEITGFEHLHLHSAEASILDAVGFCHQYAEKAKKNNHQYLCLSDHGSMAAVPSQLRACDKFGTKPVIACEIYIQRAHNPDTFADLPPEERVKIKKSYHLLLIAASNVGYSNLVQITSFAEIHGFYYKPRVNWDVLKKFSEGLIVGSCCIMGEVGQAFVNHGEDAAEAMILDYRSVFGDNYYLEMMMIDYAPQRAFNQFLVKMHLKHNIHMVLTNDVHYVDQQDHEAQTNLLLVQSKRTRAELDKLVAAGNDMFEVQDKQIYFKNEQQLNEKWENDFSDIIPLDIYQEAKRNTVRICQMAEGVRIDRSIKLPEIPDADEKLKEAIKVGFKKRNLPNTTEYKKRIAEEYDLITRKGFSSYFLIQQQVIDEARRYCRDVLGTSETNAINPGRGSAASSLVLYTMGITDIDSVHHGLLFSRFLSEARGRAIDYKFDINLLEPVADK
jgi:DNA polymerase-3 subunit alpha